MTTLTAPHPSEESTVPSRHPLAPLFDVGTVRARSLQVLRSVEQDLSGSFKVDAEALSGLARRVATRLAAADPATAASPSPSSAPLWQHLQAGGIDRQAELDRLLAGQPAEERARSWLDLAVLGVLLSADPGPRWRCTEQSALPTAAFAQGTPDELLAMLDRAGKTAPGLAAARRVAEPAAADLGVEPAAAAPAAEPAAAAPAAEAAAPGHADELSAAAPAAEPAEAAPATRPAAAEAPPPAAAVAIVAEAARPLPQTAAPAATYGGPEGLAVVAFRAFVAGAFSADKGRPCRVDAGTLRHIDVAAVRAILQGTPQNPVQGLEGRATVLSRLGHLLQAMPGAGGAAARPCDLIQTLAAASGSNTEVQMAGLLSELLRTLAPLWPAAPVQGLPGGDIWLHRWAGESVGAGSPAPAAGSGPAAALKDLGTGGWVPLHAIGQSLVAALALPLQHSGHTLAGLQELTAIADPSTSALMLAAGVVVPRQPRLLSRSHKLGDEAVIECRALTVALFDELTLQVHALLQQNRDAAAAVPAVAQVVQATAALLAGGGAPTLRIEGDGALF